MTAIRRDPAGSRGRARQPVEPGSPALRDRILDLPGVRRDNPAPRYPDRFAEPVAATA
ncbi:MAG: hypothetical protein U1E34_11205 [Amaricoccus sp.]